MFDRQPIIDVYIEMITLYEQQDNQQRVAHYRALLRIVEDAADTPDTTIRLDGKSVSKQVISAYLKKPSKRSK